MVVDEGVLEGLPLPLHVTRILGAAPKFQITSVIQRAALALIVTAPTTAATAAATIAIAIAISMAIATATTTTESLKQKQRESQ